MRLGAPLPRPFAERSLVANDSGTRDRYLVDEYSSWFEGKPWPGQPAAPISIHRSSSPQTERSSGLGPRRPTGVAAVPPDGPPCKGPAAPADRADGSRSLGRISTEPPAPHHSTNARDPGSRSPSLAAERDSARSTPTHATPHCGH